MVPASPPHCTLLILSRTQPRSGSRGRKELSTNRRRIRGGDIMCPCESVAAVRLNVDSGLSLCDPNGPLSLLVPITRSTPTLSILNHDRIVLTRVIPSPLARVFLCFSFPYRSSETLCPYRMGMDAPRTLLRQLDGLAYSGI